MPSLVSLGLPAPTGPKDINAYLAALWAVVEERLAEAEDFALSAQSEEIVSLLSRYNWLISAGPELESQIAEKELAIDSRNGQLTTRRSERDDLLAERAKLDSKIENTDSQSRRTELIAERNAVDAQLSEVYESIATLTGEVSSLTAEMNDLTDTLNQIDTSFVILLSAIVRERTPVDNDSQSSENSRVERSEEWIAQIRDQVIDLNLSQMQIGEQIDFLKELKDKEGVNRLTLFVMQVIREALATDSNGGILPDLQQQGTDGRRIHVPV